MATSCRLELHFSGTNAVTASALDRPQHPTLVPTTSRLGPVHIAVTDAERALSVWRDMVGLTVLSREDERISLGAGDAHARRPPRRRQARRSCPIPAGSITSPSTCRRGRTSPSRSRASSRTAFAIRRPTIWSPRRPISGTSTATASSSPSRRRGAARS